LYGIFFLSHFGASVFHRKILVVSGQDGLEQPKSYPPLSCFQKTLSLTLLTKEKETIQLCFMGLGLIETNSAFKKIFVFSYLPGKQSPAK